MIRILIAKPGLDGHDRGAKVIARALRDAGFEVIYTGIRQTPEMIVETAIQEDVDAIGASILSGAHNILLPRITKLLKKRGVRKLVFAGGIIPKEDMSFLKKNGISKIFTPGVLTSEIIVYLKKHFRLPSASGEGLPLPDKSKDGGLPSASGEGLPAPDKSAETGL